MYLLLGNFCTCMSMLSLPHVIQSCMHVFTVECILLAEMTVSQEQTSPEVLFSTHYSLFDPCSCHPTVIAERDLFILQHQRSSVLDGANCDHYTDRKLHTKLSYEVESGSQRS